MMDFPTARIRPSLTNQPQKQCEHKYVHYDTKNLREYFVTSGMTLWTRIDYFYCEKCLEEKEKRKSETNRHKPEWY